jgi:hypothetical protein
MIRLVGAARFELTTPCAQGRCATRLRYAPTFYIYDSKPLSKLEQMLISPTAKTVTALEYRVKTLGIKHSITVFLSNGNLGYGLSVVCAEIWAVAPCTVRLSSLTVRKSSTPRRLL